MLDSHANLQPRLDEIIAAHMHREGPLLPILQDVQAEWGHVPAGCHGAIAEALNITRAELHGVISFYHDFRDHPPGRHTIRLCRAEACQAMGGTAVADAAKAALGVDWHGTTTDGAVTLEPVFCLGLCACAPAAQVDGKLVGRVDADRLAQIIAGVRA
jgi:formate dehydrogenase subunit gamma